MELRSPHVRAALDGLRRRAASGLYRPGDRFLSARAAAADFGVSYQTAHRLLQMLVDEGVLERRPQSGTFLAGGPRATTAVLLVFHARARRPGSFGDRLLHDLLREAPRFGLDQVDTTFDPTARPAPHQFPVLWERPDVAAWCVEHRRSALLINDRPKPGLAAMGIDSVSIDDFAGGAAAGEYLRRVVGGDRRFCVLAGPRRDRRSRERVAGFTSELDAKVVYASSWFAAAAEAVAPRLFASEPDGVFCCNDRLAQGLLLAAARHGRDLPHIVGFDDAPIAAQLNLSTVAIPWPQLAQGVLQRARHRVRGDRGPASHLLFYPELIARSGRRDIASVTRRTSISA